MYLLFVFYLCLCLCLCLSCDQSKLYACNLRRHSLATLASLSSAELLSEHHVSFVWHILLPTLAILCAIRIMKLSIWLSVRPASVAAAMAVVFGTSSKHASELPPTEIVQPSISTFCSAGMFFLATASPFPIYMFKYVPCPVASAPKPICC
jgi:hypothetical protein